MDKKMSVYFTNAQSSSSNPYMIWLSNHLLTYFGIQMNEKVWVRYGSERIQVICKGKMDETCFTVQLPEEIRFAHHFPEFGQYHTLTYDQLSKELRIGPIIAVITEKIEHMEKPFGNITGFSKEIASLCRDHLVTFYLFSLEDVLPDCIFGYTIEDGKPVQKAFPYPDIIHNRISTRSVERSETCARFFEHCQEWGIPYFNDHFITKWDVYRILVECNALAAYLPETHKEMDEETLKKLMARHTSLYLKPNNGREGKGIIRINKMKDGKFRLESSSKIDPPIPLLSTVGVWKFINHFVPLEDYITQQGIPLITHSNGNVDFRILCNRNEKGDWCITSSIARVSDTHSIVTNMAYGGQAHPLSDMLLNHFERTKAYQIKALLYELALETSKSINMLADGIFGEFGIDFGVDLKGHPWILEVNTKPSKQYLSAQKQPDIRPSARGIFLFANYLYTNFKTNESRKEYDHA